MTEGICQDPRYVKKENRYEERKESLLSIYVFCHYEYRGAPLHSRSCFISLCVLCHVLLLCFTMPQYAFGASNDCSGVPWLSNSLH